MFSGPCARLPYMPQRAGCGLVPLLIHAGDCAQIHWVTPTGSTGQGGYCEVLNLRTLQKRKLTLAGSGPSTEVLLFSHERGMCRVVG
jgi:hypothetical protein